MTDPANPSLSQPPVRTINTPRLMLRTLQVQDTPSLLPMLRQHAVMRWTKAGVIISDHEQAERWVSARALGPHVVNFVIKLRDQPEESIGVMGSFHPPAIGYLINADHAGKGYATEALTAIVAFLFDQWPRASEGRALANGTGFDHVEAMTDTENHGSMRVLEKCGFTRCATLPKDFENAALPGLRDTAVFRIARPGHTLADLGLLPENEDEDEKFVPPVE
nr:putative n-acetyltransferase ynad [Quercus suber]